MTANTHECMSVIRGCFFVFLPLAPMQNNDPEMFFFGSFNSSFRPRPPWGSASNYCLPREAQTQTAGRTRPPFGHVTPLLTPPLVVVGSRWDA